jgi:hypothetical protein
MFARWMAVSLTINDPAGSEEQANISEFPDMYASLSSTIPPNTKRLRRNLDGEDWSE